MWKFIHHTVAHPLMGLFFNAGWTERFHSYTAEKAWPKEQVMHPQHTPNKG